MTGPIMMSQVMYPLLKQYAHRPFHSYAEVGWADDVLGGHAQMQRQYDMENLISRAFLQGVSSIWEQSPLS